MTRQERIWIIIRDQGPISVAEIAAQIALSPRHTSHSLYDMRRRNKLTCVGGGCRREWTVPKGAVYKPGGKGSNPNSRKNLCRDHWQKGLAAIRTKRRIVPRTDPTLLDQCWAALVASKAGL
jgi:hypothetical protein